jgi:hypothetical protein
MKGVVKRNISTPTGITDGKPIVTTSPVSVEEFPRGLTKLRSFIATTWHPGNTEKQKGRGIGADHSSI